MNGRCTSSIKMKKESLFTLEEMCEKIQKSMNCVEKISEKLNNTNFKNLSH